MQLVHGEKNHHTFDHFCLIVQLKYLNIIYKDTFRYIWEAVLAMLFITEIML